MVKYVYTALSGFDLCTGVFLDCPNEFTVDARSVSPNAQGKVRAIVTSPSGQKNDTLVKNNGDGTYNVLYTPFEQGSQIY